MKLTPTHLTFFALGAGIGVLSVLLLAGDEVPNPASAAREERLEAPARTQIDSVPGAAERALRRRIGQLEAELAASRAAAAAALATNSVAAAESRPPARPDGFRPPSPREMMENLRKSDPKRYEEFRRRFAQMRKRQLERTKGRLDFLGSLDTSGMSEEERVNHEKLQSLLAQRENLPEPSENMTDEEMRASMQQRRELDRAIRSANAAERTALLKQTADALGLTGEDASVLTETIQDVIRATESEHGGPHGPPPPAP